MFDCNRREIDDLEYDIISIQKVLNHNNIYCSGKSSGGIYHDESICPFSSINKIDRINKKLDLLFEYLQIEIVNSRPETKIVKRGK